MFCFQTDLNWRQEITRFFFFNWLLPKLVGFLENQHSPSYHTGKSKIVPWKQRVACRCFYSSEQIMGVEGEYWEFGGGFKQHPSVSGAPACTQEWRWLRYCGCQCLSCHCLQCALEKDNVHHMPSSADAHEQLAARLQVLRVKVL